MLRSKALVVLLATGVATSAVAAEPQRLAENELDRVTAGSIYSGGSLALFGPIGTEGVSATLSALAFSNTFSATTITPPTFTTNFSTSGIARVQSVASGVGPTAASASAGSRSIVTLLP